VEIALVVNPTSGKGRGARVRDAVAARLRAGGVTVRVLEGADAEVSRALCDTAVAEGTDALVALGGDGMVHLALQSVAGTGTPLGIIPAGTGNDLAAHLGLPLKDPLAAADVVASGNVARVDAVRVGDRWFGCILGAGFDSACNEVANRLRWPHGNARYVVSLLRTLPTFKPVRLSMRLDGEPWEVDAMLVAVANARSYGGGMRIAAGADIADGLLDVVVVGAMSKLSLLRAFPRVYKGTHLDDPRVTVRQARVVAIESPGVVAYADGERFAELPVTCECVPGALRVLVPPGT
jgi:diacylglycerol kinase (ATP)